MMSRKTKCPDCGCTSGGLARPVDATRYLLRCICGGERVVRNPAVASIAEQLRAEIYADELARIARGEPIDEATLPQKGYR